MSTSNETTPDVMDNPMTDLTGFQRELLVAIGSLGERPSGQEVKNRWEAQNGEETTTGRLYPNLDELVEAGLIKRGEKDRRTNYYASTQSGDEALNQYRTFISEVGL